MSRPYCSHSIEQLEELFGDGNEAQDRNLLSQLASELENRKTLRAGRLRQAVAEALKGDSSVSPQGSSTPTRPASRKEASKPASRVPMKHKPTPEQDEAIARFETGGSLKINAFAGTGKTSTLQMLAGSTPKRGQYIAFNKAIVADARDKFPQTVNCSTTHGLAFKAMSPKYGRNIKKLTERVNANQLAELLNLKKWRVDQGHTLAPRSQSYLILETVRRFAHSAHPEPTDTHVPLHGSLLAAPDSTLEAVKAFAVRGAKHVWERMQDPDNSIPLGHDGYLKMWGLSDPIIAADFILLDEAQDTNPVVLNVLRNQPAQMIYVGDKYQQIYEWRGAINAMEEIGTDYSTFLTTSFRFGPEIAGGASKVLSILGEARPINGNTAVQSSHRSRDASNDIGADQCDNDHRHHRRTGLR